ncbi:MAG: hypothetical protein GEV12_20940 [Micromonosporaceae bacterium]|nr:hypothetical protein [Micromonosporaceae bacterium]
MERYVLPVGQPTPLERSGFLALPSADPWDRREATVPRPVADLCSDGVGFVLLAAGGVGKTTVLEWLRGQEPVGLSVDLLGLDRHGMREALEEAARTARPIYVDAVDEVAQLSGPTSGLCTNTSTSSPMPQILSHPTASGKPGSLTASGP